jgi:hypothetical protein
VVALEGNQEAYPEELNPLLPLVPVVFEKGEKKKRGGVEVGIMYFNKIIRN